LKQYIFLIILLSFGIDSLGLEKSLLKQENLDEISIKSDNLDIIYSESIGVFSGNVHVISKDIAITTGKILLHYSNSMKNIDKITIKSSFLATRKNGDIITGDSGEYLIHNKELIVRNAIIKNDKITLNSSNFRISLK
jgi:lipopolysaccharide export system protein LptA